MKSLLKKLLVTAALVPMLAQPLPAQVLEVDREEAGTPIERPIHVGTTLSGARGLATVATPDYYDYDRKDARTVVSYKTGSYKRDAIVQNTKFRMAKNEQYVSVVHNFDSKLEFSVNHLNYKRSSNPYLAGFDYHEDSTAFGMKYSTDHGRQGFALGFNFAPMTATELNLADLQQIEYLRNVYMTVSEDITPNLHGYLNVKTCSTRDQDVKLNDGSSFRVTRKDFLVSALALELDNGTGSSAFIETQFFNYRDLMVKNSDRYSFNAGLRFGAKNMNLEVLGLSLNQDPRAVIGLNVGY